jgi:hypothetical protein
VTLENQAFSYYPAPAGGSTMKQNFTAEPPEINLADSADIERMIRIEYGERMRHLSVIVVNDDSQESRAMLRVSRKTAEGTDSVTFRAISVVRDIDEDAMRSFVASLGSRMKARGWTFAENYRHARIPGKVIMFTVTRPASDNRFGIPLEEMPSSESITPLIR